MTRVTLLSSLGIVPLVHGANQIAGDTANALKANAFAHFNMHVFRFHRSYLLKVCDIDGVLGHYSIPLKCGHFGVHFPQLSNTLRGDLLAFTASAAGADITDDAHIAANRITVDGVVDAAIANAAVVHPADNGFKGFNVLGSIAVQFHIADMAGVAKCVIGRFQPDLS